MTVEGNTKDVIERLKGMLDGMWRKEFERNTAHHVCNTGTIGPEDVSDRWFNTTRRVCEDDRTLIDAMVLRLRQAGYQVVVVHP